MAAPEEDKFITVPATEIDEWTTEDLMTFSAIRFKPKSPAEKAMWEKAQALATAFTGQKNDSLRRAEVKRVAAEIIKRVTGQELTGLDKIVYYSTGPGGDTTDMAAPDPDDEEHGVLYPIGFETEPGVYWPVEINDVRTRSPWVYLEAMDQAGKMLRHAFREQTPAVKKKLEKAIGKAADEASNQVLLKKRLMNGRSSVPLPEPPLTEAQVKTLEQAWKVANRERARIKSGKPPKMTMLSWMSRKSWSTTRHAELAYWRLRRSQDDGAVPTTAELALMQLAYDRRAARQALLAKSPEDDRDLGSDAEVTENYVDEYITAVSVQKAAEIAAKYS